MALWAYEKAITDIVKATVSSVEGCICVHTPVVLCQIDHYPLAAILHVFSVAEALLVLNNV